jgi:hypothetical protein
MQLRVAMAALIAAQVGAMPAAADWFHKADADNPFEGGVPHLAMAADFDGMAVGFRCTSGDWKLMFLVPEKPDPASSASAKGMPAKLLVIVDDEPKVTLPAEVEIAPTGEQYRITSDAPGIATLARSTAAARRRFAIAVEMFGKLTYSKAFDVVGSRRALGPLIADCSGDQP